MGAAIFERQAAPGDEVFDGRGDEHLAWPGECCDPGADMHADPSETPIDQLDLAGVNAGAELKSEWCNRSNDRAGALHRAPAPVSEIGGLLRRADDVR
jgi:hypothetical protein